MSPKVRLSKATEKDLSLIERLLKSNNLALEDIPQKVNSLFVAHADSKVIGVGGVEVYGDVGLLRSLVIEGSLRGKGYGKALVDKIIENAKVKGVKELYLLTTTAESFFTQRGFQKIKRDAAPAAIQNTAEFKEICPVSSILMWRKI